MSQWQFRDGLGHHAAKSRLMHQNGAVMDQAQNVGCIVPILLSPHAPDQPAAERGVGKLKLPPVTVSSQLQALIAEVPRIAGKGFLRGTATGAMVG